jgi:hypothetical protein
MAYRHPATMSRIHQETRTIERSISEQAPLRFGLRSLFILLAAVGIACALLRSLMQNDSSLFFGVGAFCYGGIIAIPVYAFVGSLMVLTTTTTWGQRTGEIFAAAVGALAWIAFIVIGLNKWPQLCVVQSLAVVGIIVWLVRVNCKIEDGPSPEGMLRRLIDVKQHCHDKETKKPTNA